MTPDAALDGGVDAGDLVLVPFPFTDLSARKTRPALVLSRREYNEASEDVILLGVTSNLRRTDRSVLLDTDDMDSGELVATSRIKVDKVATLQQDLLRRKVGRIKERVLERVLKEFWSLFPKAD